MTWNKYISQSEEKLITVLELFQRNRAYSMGTNNSVVRVGNKAERGMQYSIGIKGSWASNLTSW